MGRSPRSYRDQADGCRDLAASETVATVRTTLFEVADQYERLADEVERRDISYPEA